MYITMVREGMLDGIGSDDDDIGGCKIHPTLRLAD